MGRIITLQNNVSGRMINADTKLKKANASENSIQFQEMVLFNLTMVAEKYPGKILFTISEVAAELNLSYETVRKFVKEHKIKSIVFGSRRMIHINELSKIISEGVHYGSA